MGDVGDIIRQLQLHFNVLLYGPPGTGKTYLMQEVVQQMRGTGGDALFIDTASEDQPIVRRKGDRIKVGWVTFHQSYSYEEFIVGLRPDPAGKQLLSLDPSPGILLELAEWARLPGHAALLIIDEINRGNVSRIFGEFITLIEADKRLDEGGKPTDRTVAINLPYIKPGADATVDVDGQAVHVENPFTMPRRLFTLASMNSVDKSIAPLDSALRRRFQVIETSPDLEQMAKLMHIDARVLADVTPIDTSVATREMVLGLALKLVARLNSGIGIYLGPEFTLGEWYLTSLLDTADHASASAALKEIWDNKLYPQLAELFHGRPEQLGSVLRLAGTSAPVFLEPVSDEMADLGAAPYVRRREADISETLAFLGTVVGGDEPTQIAATE